jgi:outer membrane immunogenic protein
MGLIMRRLHCTVLATVAAVSFASVASAADMPAKAPVYKAPVVAPVYNWSGIYVGGNVGGAWSTTDWTKTTVFGPEVSSNKASGVIGGGQIGFQKQWDNIVAGIEVGWSGANLNNDLVALDTVAILRRYQAKVNSIFTAAGRLGYANNQWLFYGKGGYASANVELNEFNVGTGTDQANHYSQRGNGYVVGLGVEYALPQNLIVGVEYNYIRVKPADATGVNLPGWIAANDSAITSQINSVTVRLSYLFHAWQ